MCTAVDRDLLEQSTGIGRRYSATWLQTPSPTKACNATRHRTTMFRLPTSADGSYVSWVRLNTLLQRNIALILRLNCDSRGTAKKQICGGSSTCNSKLWVHKTCLTHASTNSISISGQNRLVSMTETLCLCEQGSKYSHSQVSQVEHNNEHVCQAGSSRGTSEAPHICIYDNPPHELPTLVLYRKYRVRSGFCISQKKPKTKPGFPVQNHLFPRKKWVFLSKTIFFLGKSCFSCPKPSFS